MVNIADMSMMLAVKSGWYWRWLEMVIKQLMIMMVNHGDMAVGQWPVPGQFAFHK